MLGNIMKAVLILCAAFLACGFMIDTPETRREAAKIEKQWEKEVKEKFDFDALHEFLKRTVAEKKQFEGVDLTAARLDAKWKFVGMSMTSGDWQFTYGSKEEIFDYTYTYADHKFVALKCARQEKDSFRLLQIYKDEWIVLSP
jgi:hypothetical protein